jgi:hypothetical protein
MSDGRMYVSGREPEESGQVKRESKGYKGGSNKTNFRKR